MRRTLVQIFASLLAAGIIGTSLIILLRNDEEPFAMDGRPSPSPTVTPSAPPLTLPPSATPTVSAAASATPAGSPTSRPPAPPPPASQPAASVDCNRTPVFCSSTTGTMEVREDKLVTSGTTQHSIDYSSVPNTTMTWRITREGGGDAQNGNDVDTLEVAVEVRNDTSDTWVVPKREVVLRVLLDGKELHKLVTSGSDFELRPGGVLTARYTIPLAFDGKYSWRGNTSFYKR